MRRMHSILNLALVCVLLRSLSGATQSKASPEEIIPNDRRIDWSHSGISGGIPQRTGICATIDSAVYGNGSTDATSAIQAALESCPDGQVVYLPKESISPPTRFTWIATTPARRRTRQDGPQARGGYLRSMVDMRGLIYWQIAGLHKTYDVLEAKQGFPGDHARQRRRISP